MRNITSYPIAFFLALTGSAAVLNQDVAAQIVPDDTLGVESSVVIPNVTINGVPSERIEGGAIRGEILFHSFEDFDISEGRGGYFFNPDGTNTIFSRVTGASQSDILGALGVLGNADLVFLNPNGILFGPEARLDLRGSFTASTASSVEFSNGEIFGALEPEIPTLLTMNVEAPIGLVFEGGNSASILNEGILAAGEDLTLSANSLDLQGQLYASGNLTLQAQDSIKIRDSEQFPFIAASARELTLQSNQEVDIFALNHSDSGLFSGGDMVLRSGKPVSGDTHFWNGGDFRVEQLDGNLGNLSSLHDPIIRSQGDVSFFGYQGTSLHILSGGSVDIDTVVINGPDTTGNAINPSTAPSLSDVTLSNDSTIIVDGTAKTTLDIRAGMSLDNLGLPLGISDDSFSENLFSDSEAATISPPTNSFDISNADISLGDVFIDSSNGLVYLTNQYAHNSSQQGDITISGSGLLRRGDLEGNGIDARSSRGDGSEVIIDSRRDITLENSFIRTSSISNSGNGGNITLIAERDTVLEPNSSLRSIGSLGGNIHIISQGDILFEANSGIFAQSNTLENEETAGQINIQANRFELGEDAFLGSITSGSANAGDISIDANLVALTSGLDSNFGTQIYSFTQLGTEGNGGNIGIRASLVELKNLSFISASTLGNGDAGDISIEAENFLLGESGVISNLVQPIATGDGGSISIHTDSFFARSESTLQTITFGMGDGGDVDINTRIFSATDGAIIEASAGRRLGENPVGGEGNSGNLTINARESIIFDGEGNDGISSSARSTVYNGSSGNGGQVNINTSSLILMNGGRINGSTRGGKAGSVNVQVENEAQFQGVGASGGSSGVYNTSEAVAFDDGGDINISAGSLLITDGAVVSANTYGNNNGGDVVVFADNILLDRGGGILSSTFGSGEAGRVAITALENITLRGSDPDYSRRFAQFGRIIVDNVGPESGIFSLTDDLGSAGDINVIAPSLNILDRAEISVSSRGLGVSGELQIIARNIQLDNQGRIVAETRSGDGGDIKINVRNLLLRNNSQISTTAGTNEAGGNGGNITINGGFIFASPYGDSDITANAYEGNGGEVDISASLFGIEFRDDETELSDITASSEQGNPGVVNINTPEIDPTQGLTVLPEEPRETEIADNCQTAAAQDSVEFFNLRQGGTSPTPDGIQSSSSATANWISPQLAETETGFQVSTVPTLSFIALPSETSSINLEALSNSEGQQLTVACHAD